MDNFGKLKQNKIKCTNLEKYILLLTFVLSIHWPTWPPHQQQFENSLTLLCTGGALSAPPPKVLVSGAFQSDLRDQMLAQFIYDI